MKRTRTRQEIVDLLRNLDLALDIHDEWQKDALNAFSHWLKGSQKWADEGLALLQKPQEPPAP